MDGSDIALSHCHARFKRLLISDFIHRTAFYHDADFRNPQLFIKFLDGFLHKTRSFKVYLIVGAAVDALPEILELFLGKIVLLQLGELRLSTILRSYSRRIKDGIKGCYNAIPPIIGRTKVERIIALILKILSGQSTLVIHIIFADEGIIDSSCLIDIKLAIGSICHRISPALEKMGGDNDWSVGTGFSHLRLQFLGEIIIALAGYHREDVGIKHMVTQYIRILAFTLLVHAKAHSSSHFLALLGLIVRVLQGADLEHVRVVPTFLQGGVREDEADWLAERKQTLLILHNQVEGTLFVLALPFLRFHRLALLVHGEVALMHLGCRIARV